MSPGRARAPSHLTSPIASVRAAYILSVCMLHMSNESMHCKVPSPNGPCGRMACRSRPKWLAFRARGTFSHTLVTAQHNCMAVCRGVVRGRGRGQTPRTARQCRRRRPSPRRQDSDMDSFLRIALVCHCT